MSDEKKASSLCMIGAPFKFGQPKDGVNFAPNMIKNILKSDVRLSSNTLDFKFFNRIDSYVDVIDLGNINPYDVKQNNEDDVLDYNVMVSNIVQENLEKGHNVLTIGGDHTIAIGSINGVLNYNPNTIVIWIDAHADINTKKTSPSGNMHGMPVAYLTGLENIPNYKKFSVLKPKLCFNQIVYIGIRDLDEGEKKFLKDHNIMAYWSQDVKRIGILQIMKDILAKLDPAKNKNFHLSLDIDGIDPEYAPSTGTIIEKGLNDDEIFTICDVLRETKRLRSMDMVEVNPLIGSERDKDKTLRLATDCIRLAMIGQ